MKNEELLNTQSFADLLPCSQRVLPGVSDTCLRAIFFRALIEQIVAVFRAFADIFLCEEGVFGHGQS